MRKKIIGSDFDGTLNRGGKISVEDLDAIARFRAAGGLFGIVTGRSILDGFGQFRCNADYTVDFVIGLNGSRIVDGNNRLLSESPMDAHTPVPAFGGKPLLRAVVEDLLQHCKSYVGITASDRRIEVHADYPEGHNEYRPWTEIDTFDTFTMVNSIMDTADAVTEFFQSGFISRYEGLMNPLQNGRCIDIPVWGMDKGKGLSVYASLVGVDEDDIWAVGDNWNDTAMLTRFHGCAMQNGAQGVKDLSEHIVSGICDVVELAMKD